MLTTKPLTRPAAGLHEPPENMQESIMNMRKIAAFTLAGLLSSAAFAAGNTGTGADTGHRDSKGHSTEQPGTMDGTGVDAGGDGAAGKQGTTGTGGEGGERGAY